MAKVKFYKINNSVLSSLPKVEGQLIFVQDTGKLYIDKDNSNRVEVQGDKLSASDITVSQTLTTGVEIGSVQVGSNPAVKLYAPPSGGTDTQIVSARQTYYLTAVSTTAATPGDQIYNTRLSNTFQGVKYETSTSAEGGRLSVDDREVTLGLFYEIA